MKFRILGPMEGEAQHGLCNLGGSKQRTTLAALLLSKGALVSDFRLTELLWEDRLPGTVPAQIYTYVSRLRKLFDTSASIERQQSGYLLHFSHDDLDLFQFENLSRVGRAALTSQSYAEAARLLRAALALWRGPALCDVTPYLAAAESPRLEVARLGVLEDRIDADLALGSHATLLPELRGLVSSFPLAERLRGQLMIAQVRAGRQADALDTYTDGRRVLADELGIDPGPALARLHGQVLRGELELDAPPDRSASPVQVRAAAPAPPHTLPAEIAPLIGRDAAVAALTDDVRSRAGTLSLTVLYGSPGVGKSALALRALHQLKEDFPDGQLYVDLDTEMPPSTGAVLTSFLLALGVPASEVPVDELCKLHRFRSEITGRRLLILLDNANNAESIQKLLPGASPSAVVVTSRAKLSTLHGAMFMRVEPLSPADAELLLIKDLPISRTQGQQHVISQIVERCGCLPLALCAVTSRLRVHPDLPLYRIAERLETEQHAFRELRVGDIDVHRSFNRTYLRLEPAARLLLRRLALLPVEEVPTWMCADLLDIDEDHAEHLIYELVSSGLLSDGGPQNCGARYRWHRLIRLFARERGEAEDSVRDREASVERAYGSWLRSWRGRTDVAVIDTGRPDLTWSVQMRVPQHDDRAHLSAERRPALCGGTAG
jgi:DNA-binding SARP family transcriptional activator